MKAILAAVLAATTATGLLTTTTLSAGASESEARLEVHGDGEANKGMPPWSILAPKPDGWKIDCCDHAKALRTNLVMYQGEWTGKPDRVMVLVVWPSESNSLESSLQADREGYLKDNPAGKIEAFPVTNPNGMACQGVLYEGRKHNEDLDDAVVFCEPDNKASGLQLSWAVTIAKNDPAREQVLTSFKHVVEGSAYAAYTTVLVAPK